MNPRAVVVSRGPGLRAHLRALWRDLVGNIVDRPMPPSPLPTVRWYRLPAPALLAWAKAQESATPPPAPPGPDDAPPGRG